MILTQPGPIAPGDDSGDQSKRHQSIIELKTLPVLISAPGEIALDADQRNPE